MESISGINIKLTEGKLLIASLAALSSKEGYNTKTPDEILREMSDLAEKIFGRESCMVMWCCTKCKKDFKVDTYETVSCPYCSQTKHTVRGTIEYINTLNSSAKCTHKYLDGKSAVVYDSIYEMRSNDMHCRICGKEGSRRELCEKP